ncbi:MurR/RpiR family transcriptional regulator [Pelagimonas phthalicica]|uniref:MurR/RpiR family transcriptional regulator n=1 Tax=Pelagimonas phthalicica TaxID=1037362 RepID=UPI001414DE50|nr:MurR/RpiR family transcriptional regulator [Pelagimonas phthalicica]
METTRVEQERDSLSRAIKNAEAGFTQKEKRIAAYFQARPDAVIVEKNADIAKKLGLSPMTVTRFFRKLGFADTADARTRIINANYSSGSSRVDRRFEDNFLRRTSSGSDSDLDLSYASIEAAFGFRNGAMWTEIVELLCASDAVHITGFQTMHYLADGFSRRLSYLRDRVHLVDGIDGVYAGLLPEDGERVTLVMMDVFRYGAHGPQLAKLAKKRGIEVVILADEFCDWAAGITPHVLRFPAETHFFLAMPQGITTGLNLLLQDVSTQLGEAAGQRVKKLSEAQDYFGLFLD